MLNNKATQAKLESSIYLATQTKQCDQQGYSNQITQAKLESNFYATQARR